MRGFAKFAAAVSSVLLASALAAAPTAHAVQNDPTECSAALYQDDRRLGPERLPVAGPVGRQLVGYDRTGGLSEEEFFDTYYDSAANSWRYPPADGYEVDQDGNPIKQQETLNEGEWIDRYGSEYGAFLAPEGLPYTSRSIPPQNLVGTPAENCNYHVYLVTRDFDVDAGPIAPWFAQSGGGRQYQLRGAYVPDAPERLNVAWLLEHDYLVRLR
ncbi:TNT domain-containing protein [Saccharothrix luteola]|uniref:TNT domain-containing protein n=1 Tax=Saccharothrix luteola TaxID=2893018 RepID=UPI001E5D3084|nr:TNT domain-containing protein [Saccharothrix luteola]MCC8246906.1 TNT domain-containing protein [Saccharothrix luteola]